MRGGTACEYCWWLLCCVDIHGCKVVIGDNAGAVVVWSAALAGMWSTGVGKMRLAGGRLYVRWMGNGPGVVMAGDTRGDRWEIVDVEVESLGDWLQALAVAGNIVRAHKYVWSWGYHLKHEVECWVLQKTVCAMTLHCLLVAAAPGVAASSLSSIQWASSRGTSPS